MLYDSWESGKIAGTEAEVRHMMCMRRARDSCCNRNSSENVKFIRKYEIHSKMQNLSEDARFIGK